MKKFMSFAAAIAVVCLCFLFMGNTASAASVSVDKIAYVSTEKKSLVLKFEDFSDSGYTYTVTNTATGKQVAAGTVGAKVNNLDIGLGGAYANGTRYTLDLEGNNGDSLTVDYYTGEAVQGLNAVKNSNDALQVSWRVSNGSIYQGYRVQVAKGSNTAATAVDTEVSSGTASSRSIASSALDSAQYSIYLIGYKKINGTVCYGQGLTTSYDYLKTLGKVTGVKAKPKANAAKISWNAVSGASYYTIYKSKKSGSGYKVAATNVTGTSAVVEGLTAGRTWYFKVEAVGAAGSKKTTGARSATVKAKIPVVAGKVLGVKLTLNAKDKLSIKWDKTAKATGYQIYYKKKSDLTYKKLGTTKMTMFTLKKLDPDTKYNIQVRAYTKVNGKKYLSSQTSKTVTVKPSKYMSKNYDKLLANTVRTIGYSGNKEIYTTKNYSKEVKLAFVNGKGYSSKTDYLIWISHYTQQVTIYKGSKKNWKIIRTFDCATGTASNHSPIGVYKITYKEPGWFYTSTKELYVTHFAGRNSFHTRPLWNSGAVQNPTIGKPASHGCIRCYNEDAKYIYDNMPVGTTVVSY